MKFLKYILAYSILSASLVLLTFSISDAYVNYANGWPTPNISIKNSCSSDYTTTFNNSISAWNNATSTVNLVQAKKTLNSVSDASFADSWVGMYIPNLNDGKIYRFTILLNRRLLDSQSSNYKQSVLVHELGHALSLSDNPPESPSIMRYDRNRNIIFIPQADDINGVNYFYKNK